MGGNVQHTLVDEEEMCEICKIVKGEEKSAKVFEDEHAIGFLDIRPLFHGHVLVVPKTHYRTLGDVPEGVTGKIVEDVKIIGAAVKSAMNADGLLIAINENVSQSIPHLHIHVVPRRFGDGFKGSFWPRYKYKSTEEMNEVRDSIINAINRGK